MTDTEETGLEGRGGSREESTQRKARRSTGGRRSQKVAGICGQRRGENGMIYVTRLVRPTRLVWREFESHLQSSKDAGEWY